VKNLKSNLGKLMRARADHDKLPTDHLLRTLADRFDLDLCRYMDQQGKCTAGQFLASWAKARKAWCAYSGEVIVDVMARDLSMKMCDLFVVEQEVKFEGKK